MIWLDERKFEILLEIVGSEIFRRKCLFLIVFSFTHIFLKILIFFPLCSFSYQSCFDLNFKFPVFLFSPLLFSLFLFQFLSTLSNCLFSLYLSPSSLFVSHLLLSFSSPFVSLISFSLVFLLIFFSDFF